jgi:hypothetical protein
MADAKYATSKQIGDLLNVTQYDIKKLVKAGMPKLGQNKFNAVECTRWYINYLKENMEFGTIKDMALMIDKTERYVNKLVAEKNFPGKVAHGKYNRVTFLHAYLNFKDLLIKDAKTGGENKTDAQARLANINANLKEIEWQKELKNFVPVKPLVFNLTNLFVKFSKNIDGFPYRIINKLYAASKSKPDMLIILKETSHTLKQELSRTHLDVIIQESSETKN